MTQERRALSTPAAAAITTILLAGIGVAIWLTLIKLRLEFDPTYQSSCNLGAQLNCDRVQTSDYSSIFGYPLALWGAITYAAAIVTTWLAARRENGRFFLGALVVGGIAVCLHSLYLAYISSFVIGTYCIFCISMYAVNLAATGLAIGAFRKGGPLSDATDFVAAPTALAPIAGALLVAAAVAIPVYGSVRGGMEKDRIELAKAQMQAVTAPKPTAATPTASKAAPEPAIKRPAAKIQRPSAVSGAASNDPGIITHPSAGFRYSNVILRKGRAFFEVPVTENDYPLGPKDAAVTIVMFGDFECGYCRALNRNMAPMKKKYADKVRFVFKHWPMNNNCNKVMKGVQHPQACIAAKAANCAGEQGKFWPMHDEIYTQDLRLNAVNLRSWAVKVGVDGAKYDNCMSRTEQHPKLGDDIRAGRFARIAGTPRTYINGHLVPGVVATEILEYYIKSGLEGAKNKPKPVSEAAKSAHGMVEVKTAKGAVWIDAYEASIDTAGRARSQAGVRPAEVSWYEAKSACEKAGKRLCSEEEWVSACTGAPAIDNNSNADFTDDEVEGTLYPYGPFPEGGRCNDNQKSGGQAVATGSMARCVSPSGIYDMSANLAEWTGLVEGEGRLSGTDFRWGAKATCLKRQKRFGLGYRNNTTGFRCCADKAIAPLGQKGIVEHVRHGAVGLPVPEFEAILRDGKKITHKQLEKGVWIVSFFASWCGPCQRELPQLETFYGEHNAKGLNVLSIGVDMNEQSMRTFIDGLKLTYKVAYDAKAVSMGKFGVRGMPTSFVVVNGKIARRLVGINKTKMDLFKQTALDALAKK